MLWESNSPAIQPVGLLQDESGKTKFTSWVASNQLQAEEGERVRLYGVAQNWYDGCISVALIGWSTVHFTNLVSSGSRQLSPSFLLCTRPTRTTLHSVLASHAATTLMSDFNVLNLKQGMG